MDKIKVDDLKFHDDPKRQDMVFPQRFKQDLRLALEILKTLIKEQGQYVLTSPVYFHALEDDGLVAAHRVMTDMFGSPRASGSMFNPPEMKLVKVSLDQSIEVPYGEVTIPSLIDPDGNCAKVYLTAEVDPAHPDRGKVFSLRAYVRRMDQEHITALVAAIEKELKTGSIYRGKALIVTEGGTLDFIDLDRFDNPKNIVFTSEVQRQLDTAIFGPILRRDEMIARGVSPKQNSLLWGEWGSGKSTAGTLAARACVEADTKHTFVALGPNADIRTAIQVLGLYGPSVGFLEDVDNQFFTNSESERSNVLEALDGLSGKGVDVKLIMTTNYMEKFPPGTTRAGRIDHFIYIGAVDRDTLERIVRANTADLADDVDFDAVYEVAEGFTAAFVRDIVKKAVITAVVRSQPGEDVVLDTDALVTAAHLVKSHFDLHRGGQEAPKAPTIDSALREVMVSANQEALEVKKALLLEQARAANNEQNIDTYKIVSERVETGINSTGLYDRNGDDKKGQLVVE